MYSARELAPPRGCRASLCPPARASPQTKDREGIAATFSGLLVGALFQFLDYRPRNTRLILEGSAFLISIALPIGTEITLYMTDMTAIEALLR